MSPTFAVKTVSSKVLSSFGIVLAFTFAFLVLVFVFLIFVDFGFLSFTLTLTFLVTLAFLAFSSFTHHRQIHGYSIVRGRIRLCSTIIK